MSAPRGMNLSAWALQHRTLTLFAMLAVAAAGVWAYLSLGRAEDPPFTIKQMVIVADWPGASAGEMMREVTDRIERKLEELPDLDYTQSYSEPGSATITVTLKDRVDSTDRRNRSLLVSQRHRKPTARCLTVTDTSYGRVRAELLEANQGKISRCGAFG